MIGDWKKGSFWLTVLLFSTLCFSGQAFGLSKWIDNEKGESLNISLSNGAEVQLEIAPNTFTNDLRVNLQIIILYHIDPSCIKVFHKMKAALFCGIY